MKLQHTPGPWKVKSGGSTSRFVTNGIVNIARLMPAIGWAHEMTDNARLIAAAPEMLEALISIQRGMQPYKNESGVINVSLHCWRNLKSIIESATGMTIDEVLEVQS